MNSFQFKDNFFDVNKIPDYCTKEKLEKFYNEYLHNLKETPFKMVWIHPTEIQNVDLKSWTVCRDKYLHDSNEDRVKLGYDVLENGTYWPLFAFKNDGRELPLEYPETDKDYKYKLRDGGHRLWAIQELCKRGEWPEDKKILIYLEDLRDDYDPNKINEFYMPLVLEESLESRYNVYKELRTKGLNYVDEDKETAIWETKHTGYFTHMIYSLLLRNAFFEYKEKSGEMIKPSIYMNNEEAWNEWIKQ